MHTVVKVTRNEDGDIVQNQVWCLVNPASTDCERILCDSQAIGYGESAVEYEEKEVERGGITCKKCLFALKLIKAVKL